AGGPGGRSPELKKWVRSTDRRMMRRLVAISLLAATAAFAQNEDSSDESGSPGVVTLAGTDRWTFNSNRSPLRVGFALAGETYDPDPTTLRIFLDGEPQDTARNDTEFQPQR